VHQWMRAYIAVFDHPFFAVTSSGGRFAISNLPPGQYTLVAWHKAAGFFRKTIVVEAGHDAFANFFIPIDDDAHAGAPVKEAAMSMAGDK